ncbi:DUF2852 domain-containing protein [Jannaschia sp. W003]|uniref:DUF2852 domain-containing protein n=1 Tax=Jannaschia sp. W003 TaxID=2867012 RepID=UPI0021A784A2|nr:DUF2852 domain-containing protein [Jannaschia sp. W003]UWQ20281.1 DUF2852 domain-containing protein [Jannaschia sp. W003]
MQSAPAFAGRPGAFLSRAESWLDARGRGAWIAAMVLGFILFWPVGLAFVLYMTMSGKWSLGRGAVRSVSRMGGTGNAAFDSYKEATLRRLEDEQRAFEEFLQRLREAKDKAEFDQFMDEQSKPRGDDDAREVA